MKYFSLAALALGAALCGLSSCDKVLDKQNLGAIEGTLIYNDSTLANLSLNYIYDQNLPVWFGQGTVGFATVNPTGLSDESYNDNAYVQGIVQMSDVTDFGTGLSSTNNYGKIRTINMFIRDVRAGSLPQGTKNRLVSQAQFFRAWRYFDLVRLYGGVPLIFTPLDGVGADARNAAYLPRNTTTQTFAAIAADLDSAAAYLPGKWAASADWGHITKGAAQAFKGRALLYAASPQFTTDNTAKWQAAYDASLAARNTLVANGARLHASYDQLWFQEVNNPEAVMVTGYNTATGDQLRKNNSYDNSTRPAYTGTSGTSNLPTWEMVQAYPMLDGKMRGTSTKYPYTMQQFYKNRDPRFDKTIAYNGCTWPLNGNTSYRLWTYQKGTTSVEPSKPSNTSFYTRKAISPTAAAGDAAYIGTDWIEIRYAEVLLNLAEAACGINNIAEGYTQLKVIRARAGLEAGADGNYGLKAGMSRAEMFDAILFERQIEFAFEGKRFWDLRRYNKLGTVLNNTIKRRNGLTITLNAAAPTDFATTRDNLNLDNVYTNYFTIAVKNVDTKYNLNWLDNKYNFFGIPQSAIDNNPQLVQNNTWGGAFDPLQ